MKAVGVRPLFNLIWGAFDATRVGEIIPDLGERVALLVVRVELGRGFRRAYARGREVKAVSLLPGGLGSSPCSSNASSPDMAGIRTTCA